MNPVYPKIGGVLKKQRPKGICKICGMNLSDSELHIQVNVFRGDDEVFNIHGECFNSLDLREKARFLNELL